MGRFSEWRPFDIPCLSFFILTQPPLLPPASERGPSGKDSIQQACLALPWLLPRILSPCRDHRGVGTEEG